MPRVARTTSPVQTTDTNGSGVKELLEQVDKIKDALKTASNDLTAVTGRLKVIDKEKRTTQKEVEGIRKQLRRIQTVTI